MKKRSALAGVLATAVATSVITAVGAGPAAATNEGVASWGSSDADRSTHGVLALYDAAGHALTHGSLSGPLATYAVSGDAAGSSTKATLFAYTPQTGAAGGGADAVGGWTGLALSGSSTIGASYSTAYGKLASGSTTLGQYLAQVPNTSNDASFQNLYELRLRTGAAGVAPLTGYAAVDVQVDTAKGVWWLANAAEPTAAPTTTTLAVDHAGLHTGGQVTLTATASQPGVVTFSDGATSLGTASVATAGGTATKTFNLGATGAHTFEASLAPTDSGYDASFGTLDYAVTPTATQTASVAATPAGAVAGSAVTLSTSVTPASVAGSVQFKVDGANVGAPVAVSGGTASTPWTAGAAGAHSLGAVFTPADTTDFSGSSAVVSSYTVTAPSSSTPTPTPTPAPTTAPAPAPVTVTAVTAPKTLKSKAKSLTLTLVSTGTVTGTVKVYDGSKLVGTATVSGGKVVVKLKKKLKKGKHTIKVVFAGSSTVSAFTKTVKVTVK